MSDQDTSAHSRASVATAAGSIAPKRKKKVKLTKSNANTLQHEVQINLVKHVLAAKHFEFRHFWWFSIPQALLTTIASILAFIGGAGSIAENSEKGEASFSTDINLVVGCLSAITVLFQTVSGFKNFDKRADRHTNTAIQLRDLRDQLKILVIKLKSEEDQDEKEIGIKINFAKSVRVGKTPEVIEAEVEAEVAQERAAALEAQDDENSDDFNLIQKKFQQSLAGCTSYVPLQLGECFHGLQSNLELKLTLANKAEMKLRYGEDFDECILISKAIDMLAANILSYRWFPMDIPDPKKMIKDTMEELEQRMIDMDTPFKKGKGSEALSRNDSQISMKNRDD